MKPGEETAETSLHDDIAKAFGETEEAIDTAAAAAAEPEDKSASDELTEKLGDKEQTEEQRAEQRRAKDGKFAKGKVPAPAVKPAEKVEKPDQAAAAAAAKPTGDEKPPPEVAAAAGADKAPQSWKPAAREAFAKLPAEVRAVLGPEINRRERETAIALQRGAEGTKIADQLHQVMSPYLGLIQQEGSHPFQAISRTMATGAALRANSPTHVASTMAGIVQEFGLRRFGPQFVEILAQALDGQAPAAGLGPAPGQPGVPQDPRVDQLLSRIEQAQVQRQQAAQAQRQSEIETFAAKHEFFDDVKGEMSDLMAAAHARGITLTLDQAYQRACSFHPEIASVLQQRREAEAAKTAQAATSRARKAGASPRPAPTAAGVRSAAAQSGSSLRADIEAAIEQVSD